MCTVALLLHLGANVNVWTRTGESALMKAARRGYIRVVREILDWGSHMSNPFGDDGNTVLQHALLARNRELIQMILMYQNR